MPKMADARCVWMERQRGDKASVKETTFCVEEEVDTNIEHPKSGNELIKTLDGCVMSVG